MALSIKASDILNIEDIAAEVAYKQDAGYHASNQDEIMILNDYKKYWVSDSKQGHIIKICYGNDDRVLTIDCRWQNRKRDKTNRVRNVKIKNYA